MAETIIKIEDLYKEYRLGVINHGVLFRDLQSWWARRRGKDDPNVRVTALRSADWEKDHFFALQKINLDIEQGEVLGVIGRNGAGKSTLLKILSRITSPTSGEIKIKGRIASLLEVGTGFHPELTGRENVYLNGAILGMRRREIAKKMDEIIEFAEIEKFIDTPVKRYSSGMYVRLAFAVAAHLDAEILVLDEVLAVGDAQFQKKCLGKMDDVAKKQGRTVLFVSHNMGMIRALCKSGIVLRKGEIIYKGTADGAVNEYLENSLNSADGRTYAEFKPNNNLPAQLLNVRIQNKQGKPSLSFDVFEDIFLEAEYIVREKQVGVDMGFVLERNGEVIACSFDTDKHPERQAGREPGVYKVRLPLPTPLKAGVYNLANLGFGKTSIGSFNVNKDIFTFVVEEKSYDPTTKSYSSSRPGVLVTELDWQITDYKTLKK